MRRASFEPNGEPALGRTGISLAGEPDVAPATGSIWRVAITILLNASEALTATSSWRIIRRRPGNAGVSADGPRGQPGGTNFKRMDTRSRLRRSSERARSKGGGRPDEGPRGASPCSQDQTRSDGRAGWETRCSTGIRGVADRGRRGDAADAASPVEGKQGAVRSLSWASNVVTRTRSAGSRRRSACSYSGFVTFAHFTCQPRCALKDRAKENQSLGAWTLRGTKSTKNGVFLASDRGRDAHC